MKDKFDQIWAPRIGSEAAVYLRRHMIVTLLSIIGTPVLGIYLGLLISKHMTVGITECVLAEAMLSFIWILTRIQFAAALTRKFNRRIRWVDIPRSWSAEAFDQWLEQAKNN